MRVEVRIHGVVVVLALEKFAGVRSILSGNVCVPLAVPRRELAPAFSPPSSSSFSPPAPRIWPVTCGCG